MAVCRGVAERDHHAVDVGGSDHATPKRSAMLVFSHRRADDVLARHQLSELVGSGCAATPVLAVLLAALVPFGSVDAEQSDFGVAHQEGVAVLGVAGAEDGGFGGCGGAGDKRSLAGWSNELWRKMPSSGRCRLLRKQRERRCEATSFDLLGRRIDPIRWTGPI